MSTCWQGRDPDHPEGVRVRAAGHSKRWRSLVRWSVGALGALAACTVACGGVDEGGDGLDSFAQGGGGVGATTGTGAVGAGGTTSSAGLGGAGASEGVDGGGLAGRGGGATGGFGTCGEPGAVSWASEVLDVSYGPGAGHGQDAMPEIVLGPPHGAGCCAGSLDVLSLGEGGSIVLGFGAAGIEDGPGVDFVVFENAFQVGGDPSVVFAEPAAVEVSEDAVQWYGFDCGAAAAPWGDCAGWHPVLLDGAVDGLDPLTCGGDGFDLADVGLEHARFVRIVDRADLSGSFDLDAVGVVHPWCP